jgi:hypothetical protein
MQKHLNSCRSCRQELARLKLLWLELAEPEAVSLPPELPYLRQQVITSAIRDRAGEQKDSSIWDTLEMAWQPFLLGASFMPGVGLIPRLTQTVNQGMRRKSFWKFVRRRLTKGDKP